MESNHSPKFSNEISFNYYKVCEFKCIVCEESGFTSEGLKKHIQENISKHLYLIKKKLELNELKNEENISKINNDQVEMSEILCKMSQMIDYNENKTNEILKKWMKL